LLDNAKSLLIVASEYFVIIYKYKIIKFILLEDQITILRI